MFGALVGMGGAFVMIPAMTGILKFSQHQAHGREGGRAGGREGGEGRKGGFDGRFRGW